MNQQQQNHHLRTGSDLSYWEGRGGLNPFYWYQIFAVDFVVVKLLLRLLVILRLLIHRLLLLPLFELFCVWYLFCNAVLSLLSCRFGCVLVVIWLLVLNVFSSRGCVLVCGLSVAFPCFVMFYVMPAIAILYKLSTLYHPYQL